ncbi:hypothetical protein JOD45_003280 [Scopulibacillus daqui]|uniref:Uncharacterized protein n=1 Tax=Scopulibacillus daqui TaxID=1469162 RepID=A0ABS2Q5R2_9BACL|nr:hypothetical protein [Scopulibacillus daqui]
MIETLPIFYTPLLFKNFKTDPKDYIDYLGKYIYYIKVIIF